MHRWVREPLVHFALAGGAIFWFSSMRSATPPPSIIVTQEIIKTLEQNRQALLGRPLSRDEREGLVQEYVNEEVLIREGYARGIDKQDRLVQQRLLEVMRFLLEEEPPDPSPADLRAFLGAHEDIYRTPEKLSFSQVFYPKDGEDPPEPDLLVRLRRGEQFPKFGSRFWLGSKIESYPEPDLVPILGQGFVGKISRLPLHQWSGPIESSQGVHFVRLDAKYPPQEPGFESIASTLRTDWLNSKRGVILNRKLEALRKHYRIEVRTEEVSK